MKHFIFGYGSLICPQSRAITAPTLQNAIAEPVIIDHIERTWSARVLGDLPLPSLNSDERSSEVASEEVQNGDHVIKGWTPMGVRFKQGSRCNGVLIHVDEEELKRFDIREGGYERFKINVADIYQHLENEKDLKSSLKEKNPLDDVRCTECRLVFENANQQRLGRSFGKSSSEDSSSDLAVWVYMQSIDLPPNRSFPITQSYVDIIMRGCLSISHDFARRYLQTTQGWWHDGQQSDDSKSFEASSETGGNSPRSCPRDVKQCMDNHHTWVNDRHAPMYVRADRQFSFKMGEEIDKLIGEQHAHALKRRVVSM